MVKDVFLAGGMRTAIGSLCGVFSETTTQHLGGVAIRAALEKAGVKPDDVEEVIMGNVIQAGLGQNPARQASFAAGLPDRVRAMTINKVCGSGLKSVMLASQAVQCGDAHCVVAGGMENMTRVPYLLEKARTGYRMGDGVMKDAMIKDGLWDVYHDVHMGTYGDRTAEKYEFSREVQDDFAIASYQRAFDAIESGAFAREITPVEIKTRRETVIIDRDEELERFNEEKLRSLRPAFERSGSITAGNASSINDGAAAFVVLSGDKVGQLGIKPRARVVGYASYSQEPEWFTLAPVGSIQVLLERLGWSVDQVDLFEINEAFSVVPMAAMKDLGIPHEKVNVHGGAVALGHPIGASGTRILVTLVNAMEERGARTGLASLCIGGGEAVALAVERIE